MNWKKALGGALIIGGTAIGAGMLALPVVTGFGGFLPACVIYLICYLFSAATGLLLLEVCLWMPQDSNIISMAEHLLGPIGKYCAWILYLFLFYCLTIAYVSGGGAFVAHLLHVNKIMGLLIFTLAFGGVVYAGTRMIDRVNWILMIGLGVSYVAFLTIGFSDIQWNYLNHISWGPAVLALPVIFTSFSYQGTIPSLNTYLDHNPKMVRFAILFGTALPFIAYILWELLILGLVPKEALLAAKVHGSTAIEPLKALFPHSSIYTIGQFFGIFALTTSFLGVTLGLFDFLSDGLQMAKEGGRKVFLACLVYGPPVVIAAINPNIFLRCLGYAGGIGCALLLGFYPALMVWVGRYRKNYPKLSCQLFGGKKMLIALFAFVLFELVIELLVEFA